MAWYGQSTGNPLSGSATHAGQQFPTPLVAGGESLQPRSYATAPVELVIQEPPNHVVISGAGTFKFAYNLTGSIGDTLTAAAHGHNFITALIKAADAEAPVRLDISPSAWDGTSTTSPGDVTFVYSSKRSK